jgi:FAD/FMN-containing dehydrogenase
LYRGQPGYEDARRAAVWNARKPDRFPDVIAVAASEQDVLAAVVLARTEDLKIAVRSGGHSMCGSAVRDGGMLLDVSLLRQLSVDPVSRTASVQPAVQSREFARALGKQGLAFPVGHHGSVALSGYLLAGGLGWGMRLWGPACHSVERVEVVTADAELVSADETHNQELFWAARGAGPGFCGVATRFHLRVNPLPKAIRSSTYLYPLADVDEVSRWAGQLAPNLPDTMELLLLLGSAPPAVGMNPPGKVVGVIGTVFADDEDDAAKSLALLESCPCRPGAVFSLTNKPSSFDLLHDTLALRLPEEHRYVQDTLWSEDDFGVLLPRLAEHIVTAPSAKSLFMATMRPFGHAPDTPDTAFSMVANTLLLCYAIWENEKDDNNNVTWLRQAAAGILPRTTGHYIAEADLLAGPSRAADSFSAPAWSRLQAQKVRYDPGNMFHTFLGSDM